MSAQKCKHEQKELKVTNVEPASEPSEPSFYHAKDDTRSSRKNGQVGTRINVLLLLDGCHLFQSVNDCNCRQQHVRQLQIAPASLS